MKFIPKTTKNDLVQPQPFFAILSPSNLFIDPEGMLTNNIFEADRSRTRALADAKLSMMPDRNRYRVERIVMAVVIDTQPSDVVPV